MATLEKPQKNKRSRNRRQTKTDVALGEDAQQVDKEESNELMLGAASTTTDTTTEERRPSLQELEQFEIVTTTANKDKILSHACAIASDYKQEEDHEDKQDNVSLKEELSQAQAKAANLADTESDILQPWTTNFEQATAPSAPPAVTDKGPPPEASVINASPIIVQYPNLTPLQLVETKSQVHFQTPKTKTQLCGSKINQPYTAEQLKQIYHCAELELVKQFELQFLMNSLLETYDGDPLYAALLEYYNLQSKLTMNLHDLKKYRKAAGQAQESIWTQVPISKTFTAQCADRVELKETVTYNIAQVNGKNLESASAKLTQLFDLISFTYTYNLITAQITKVKIDQIINEIISYPRISALAENAEITLQYTVDPETLQCVAHLRRAIAILFSFTRKLSPNTNFDADLKIWLRKLISLHLIVATKEDHWFLLFNILRCPSGVGSWATEFLQVPCTTKRDGFNTPTGSRPSEIPLQLDSNEIKHCIAVLHILLLPIKKRNEYLKAFTQSHKEISDPVQEERWILIDSDGEDSHTSTGECAGLKESDLIALLNQIPFEKIFTASLNIEKFLNDYIIETDLISANQMLKVIAFFFTLVEILGEGMLTYNTERYKQLAKRLGRLIRHTLQYVSDYHELFICNNLSKDAATCDRIAVELNALLIKACSYIYRTRNLATWQYFSSLPFLTLSADTVWQIFYYLNVGFPTEFPTPFEDHLSLFNATDFWTKFNVANADSSAEDLYYLLQAFFEIANERDQVKDWELIKAICLHIFNIGFINEPTRDICYKTARDMLLNLTLAYEDLISCLLLQLKVRFNEIENATYLFKSLPLECWKPGMDSFEILSNWLLHYDFKSSENMLARIIISHLNWGIDCDGQRLFLPHNIHVRMACLLSEALTKHAPEVIGLSSITESVRQVSSLIDFTQSTKEQFATWCWSMVSVLRLHLMDQSVDSIKRTLQNPTEPLMFVPDLERIEMIYQGVSENRPLAYFVAILVSLHGHSIPLICQKGFELLKQLLNDHRHAAVIRSLELIVPLFLDTPETLANCESFHAIFQALLNADKTYLKMAKDIVYPNAIGPVLELLDNMIHHQITSYTDYGLATPLNLINVWLNCLTTLPNWQTSSVVYLLDRVLRVSYQFPDARLQAVEYFRNYYKNCDDWKGSNKKSALKTFFSANQSRIPSLSPSQGWLALVLLDIEYKTQDAYFWPEFLRQFAHTNGKNALDTALKKTAAIVKMPMLPAQQLVIYKYANIIAYMDISHPMFPVLNQKFFELYLSRLPLENDENSFQNTFGVSDKFYEYNVPLMKKIKTNLKAAETFYANEASALADDEPHSYFYRSCTKLMTTFALWLEETSINRKDHDALNFPPQYNNEKLYEILNGNTQHWTEYIYLPAIRKEQKHQAEQWARKCFRQKTSKRLRSPLQPKAKSTAVERIKSHLSSYDKRVKAPQFVKPEVYARVEIKKSTFGNLKMQLKKLNKTANDFHLKTSELNAVSRNYLDTVVYLYKMVPYNEIKIKSCNSLVFNRKCTGPARIITTLEHIRKEENVERKLQTFRERHDKLIDEMLTLDAENFAKNVEELSGVIKVLINAQITATGCNEIVTYTAVNLFYSIIENLSDITIKFQPTNELYTQMLNELGIFIQENQEQHGLEILQLTMKRPDLLKVLAGVFVPCRTRPAHFLKMYKFLIDSHLKRCDTKILFVLLSKFDLLMWLETFQPKFYDITQLLQLVLHGLECWSQQDSSLLQDQFRRHLVHIFAYDFPQHYGEVMQVVLNSISEQKLMPAVLLDLLNSLLTRFNCDPLNMDSTDVQLQETNIDFARRQNLFDLKTATETVALFARHFQKERLNHGLHGLYPKHKEYCKPLAMWFSCFGHVVTVKAICTYQDLLADQISDVIFSTIIDMYSPWLIAYSEETMQQMTANWIRQLKEQGKMLYPWSEQHANTSKIMIKPFINTLTFVLEHLPASHKILEHTFGWYVHHFAIPQIEPYVYAPIHEGIAVLPWEHFKPQMNYVILLHESLQKFLPNTHAMLGHIFIRINWNAWFAELLPTYALAEQTHVVSLLFTIFIKIAFEPNIHIHINTSKILEDAIKYPWHLVEYAELENIFKWFVSTVEPTIILKIPTESNYADRAVLDLLRLASAMMPERNTTLASSNATAKRIIYTRAIVRLLRSCAAKNHKILATKDGVHVFNVALMELLTTMDNAIAAIATTKSLEERKREAANLMIELIVPMQTQSEETSNLHIDTLIQWQQQQPKAANLLMLNTLNAIGHMKGFISGIYALLESTIVYYFRTSEETKDWHSPTWLTLLQTLQMSLDKLELLPIISGGRFLTLHIFILYKIERIENSGDKITFLQDLSQLLESVKTEQHTESHLAIVWGLIISRGCKILADSEHAKKPLLMLARHLHVLSTQSEGWSDGLLGAIGLKKDNVTIKRKVLTRCLACVIFSLFPIISNSKWQANQEFEHSLQELTMLLANKKFIEVKPLIVKAVGIIKEQQVPELRDVPHLICRLIALFYQCNFLTTIPEVWEFDFKFN